MKKVSVLKMATSYAEAMYDSASQIGNIEILYADAQALNTLFDDGFDELSPLDNPMLKFEQKEQIVRFFVNELSLCETTFNTLKVLAQNNKLHLLSAVIKQFILMYQNKHNIAEIEVTTVIELSKKQEKLLKEKLSAIFNKQIILRYVINPQIIGGLILKYETHFIDNSIKRKLNTLEQLMKGTK